MEIRNWYECIFLPDDLFLDDDKIEIEPEETRNEGEISHDIKDEEEPNDEDEMEDYDEELIDIAQLQEDETYDDCELEIFQDMLDIDSETEMDKNENEDTDADDS